VQGQGEGLGAGVGDGVGLEGVQRSGGVRGSEGEEGFKKDNFYLIIYYLVVLCIAMACY
jgi:hypothetical protein